MPARPLPWLSIAALILGLAQAASFAPFGLPWLQVVALAGLFLLVQGTGSARQAAWLGWCFGMGWFGLGISWIFVSLHFFGGLPAPLAVLATAALCAFLALYPALALGVARRWVRDPRWLLLAGLPAAWAGSEWLRGTLFTGFPWVASGYAHSDGPLAGYAPLLGVYGIGLMAALVAGSLALLVWLPLTRTRRPAVAALAALLIVVLGGAGQALRGRAWSEPAGEPVVVRLVQGNVPQDEKFTPEGLDRAFELHHGLMLRPAATPPRLTVLPESVFPVPLAYVPASALRALERFAEERDSALIFGVFLEEPGPRYYNSAVGLAPDGAVFTYSKRQLVPFGEFIPPGFRWFVDMMNIPIGDQERGATYQPPMPLAGQRVAVNICYEDLFGAQIAAAWADPAAAPTMLVNLSNLAWFGDSLALPQHLQISRLRALETARPMLRATNTGATAVIDAQGRVQALLPFNTLGVLDVPVQATRGTTPYVRWTDAPALALIGLLLMAALALGRRPVA
jgi:apolipoprotein N-acyltransferase